MNQHTTNNSLLLLQVTCIETVRESKFTIFVCFDVKVSKIKKIQFFTQKCH